MLHQANMRSSGGSLTRIQSSNIPKLDVYSPLVFSENEANAYRVNASHTSPAGSTTIQYHLPIEQHNLYPTTSEILQTHHQFLVHDQNSATSANNSLTSDATLLMGLQF